MKKNVLFALISACVLGFAFSSCSSDDTGGVDPHQQSIFGEQTEQTDKQDGQEALVDTLARQEPLYKSSDYIHSFDIDSVMIGDWQAIKIHDCDQNAIMNIMPFDVYKDPVEKLYDAPSTVEEILGKAYKFNSDIEIRLEATEENGPFEDIEDLKDFAHSSVYCKEYYKGVGIKGGGMWFYSLKTPQGPKIYLASGSLFEINNLNVNPQITGATAKNIFARNLEMPVNADWKAELCINPFMLKKNGKFYFDLKLAFYVGANAVYYDNGNVAYMDEAYVDAHTGQLLTVHRWINEDGYFASDPTKKVPDDYYN